MPNRTQHAHKGKGLEAAITVAQGQFIRVDKLDALARHIGGKDDRGRPRVVAVKGPVDYVGEVVASGRAIHFDAKQTGEARGFKLSLIEQHQLDHLRRHDAAGALCGVLAECTADGVGAFYWFPFKVLAWAERSGVRTIAWGIDGVTRLGDSRMMIPFGRVPEIAADEKYRQPPRNPWADQWSPGLPQADQPDDAGQRPLFDPQDAPASRSARKTTDTNAAGE